MTLRYADAIILWSGAAEATVAFYRALGLPLADERHDDGPLHWACELGAMHIAVYASEPGAAPSRRTGGATQVGFQVDDLDAAFAAATAAGAHVLQAPEDVPWGRRCVLEDPDGRAVELNQAPHP